MKVISLMLLSLIIFTCSPYYAIPFKADIEIHNTIDSYHPINVYFSTGDEGTIKAKQTKTFTVLWKGERSRFIKMKTDIGIITPSELLVYDGGIFENVKIESF